MADIFRIVLSDAKRHDTFETRQFNLPLGGKYPIGRASKSIAKPHLMPSAHNAYIDSPVISREHAVLSANLSDGTPKVYITDRGSMHGTMINGRKLQPETPEVLSPGDMLQFGVDVNRNEGGSRRELLPLQPTVSTANPPSPPDFFVARKYVFESQLTRPYSLGFAVPDAESEEDDVDTPQRRGSQHNPLVLDDDSDAASDLDGAAGDEQDVTMAQDLYHSDVASPEQLHSTDNDSLAYLAASLEPESRTPAIPDGDSDGEESMHYSTDEEDDQSLDASAINGTESVASSEAQASSEPEVADSEVDDDASPSSVSLAPGSPFMKAGAAPDEWHHYSDVTKSRNAFTLDEADDNHQLPQGHSRFGLNPARGSVWTPVAAPPLPPRPAQHSATPTWSPSTTNIFQPCSSSDWSALAPEQAIGTNFGDRLPLYSAPSLPSRAFTNFEDYCAGFVSVGADAGPARQSHSLQTPPPMPASDVASSTPQPVRRTKVSIEEIVEDQPPTPKSINSLKRKADEFEETLSPVAEDPPIVLPGSDNTPNEAVLDISPIQTAAIIAQRPKKQPKSVLAKVGLTAKYLGLGTAGAFAAITALSTLPDTFFV